MKYIGHLDVMRYFQKALRRAGFDTALSGGFSPHMIMSFAAPLGVGITSEGEYFDLELRSADTSKNMEDRLNAVMADGFRVLSVREIPSDKKVGGMRMVAAADYRVSFGNAVSDEVFHMLVSGLADFMQQTEIVLEKRSKKGSREINIRPLIYRLEPQDRAFCMLVSQGSVNNLRPELVMQALFSQNGLAMPESGLHIHRLDLYANSGTEAEPVFFLLEDAGKRI